MEGIKDLSTKIFSDLVYEKLEDLKYEMILSNPTQESTFPCLELHNPLKSTRKRYGNTPILSDFQISITCWNASKRECMEMTEQISEKLQEFNFKRTNTSTDIFDSIIKKYGITVTFEVRYNGLTNSFDLI